jgi:magnesium and cobalt transporter
MPKTKSKTEVPQIIEIKKNKLGLVSILKKFFTYYASDKLVKKKENIDPFIMAIDEMKNSSKMMNQEEKDIFSNFIKFGSKTVAKVMIPRTDVCGVSVDSKLDDILKTVAANGHTRTLVYQETMDNILGFLHIKDLFSELIQNREFSAKKFIRQHLTVAPSMKLVDLLAEMQKKRTHIAVVIDEYGGTDGVATIEDIIEELVGEIEDEHDAQDNIVESFKIINPKTILCNARTHIEEIENALSMKLKKQDDYFETIGGLVLARAGYFPKTGTSIVIDENIAAEIIEANARSIKTVKLKLS